MPRARHVALLSAVALVAAGCSLPTGGSDGDGPRPAPVVTEDGVAWRDCSDVPVKLYGRAATGVTYQCATIEVPRDWAEPTGEKLRLELLRARAAGQRERIGSLVVNPGGPGASGIDTAVALSFGDEYGGVPDEVTRRFDLVGFDPRGVSRSSPVDCVDDADLDEYFGADQDPVGQPQFDAMVDVNRRMALDCLRKYGDTLTSYSTEQAARDMDAVRAAVGDEKLTYLGYSYGTLLGATYAQLYPKKVRALVLDGAVDPRADTVTASEGQARGFEKAFDNFAAWCRRTPRDCPIAPDARAAMTAALADARVSPARGRGGRQATAGWVLYAAASALYSQDAWKDLALGLDRLADGDPAKVFELADRYVERDPSGGYSTMFDAFFAINCADDDSDVTAARTRELQAQWRRKYPTFGGPLAIGLLTCAAWPARPDPYPTGPAVGAPPIVVVGTVGDPATPYEQTAKLARMLGVGRVLTWEGEGHTAYPETECITEAVNAYLLELAVPTEGLRCPAR